MERPIGVIDSGIGGLTVLYELKRQLPKEEFVYLGDTLRCPYGSKKADEVRQYTWEIVEYLLTFDIKLLVVACNTATAIVLEELKQYLSIPVVGVIEPGARAAIKSTETEHVGIIGTENTISSQAYEYALKQINPNIQTVGVACPRFVPLIESGRISGPEAKQVVHESLVNIKNDSSIDALILGCTHYPIIQPVIEDVLGKRVTVLSSALETGAEVSASLTFYNMHTTKDEFPLSDPLILTTGSLSVLQRLKDEIFHFTNSQVKQVSIL
ncbi:glutamate racemase [Alkalibacillus filiformis]|uniref:Glutamate racemase n=1 Tax=Alkalibacillus filiformis TaxID=200990 RepID=A0ABU0DRW7_9BACI|nr:glutamate racemase [Alkalibacillus filiformis]MDQ0351187.1 glutamate racemase [Alkalibacillus filiformis]